MIDAMRMRFLLMCARVPSDLIALLARIGMGVIFLRSGLLKVDGWESGVTLALFTEEYRLPLLDPGFAAALATSCELSFGVMLIAGIGTRIAALGMLVMTAVIEILVYPNAFDTHASWAAC